MFLCLFNSFVWYFWVLSLFPTLCSAVERKRRSKFSTYMGGEWKRQTNSLCLLHWNSNGMIMLALIHCLLLKSEESWEWGRDVVLFYFLSIRNKTTTTTAAKASWWRGERERERRTEWDLNLKSSKVVSNLQYH